MDKETEKQALEAYHKARIDGLVPSPLFQADCESDQRIWMACWEARGRTSGQHVSEQFRNLHECANAVVAEIGAHGEISSGHRYTERLLDAVYACDPLLASGQQGVEVNYRRLFGEYIEAIARRLHYLDNYERISSLKTAQEVNEATEGGIERYRNEPIFRRKVDVLVSHLMDITHKHLAASPQITSPAESVSIPKSEDEAALMVLLGEKWLHDNAPHRIKAAQPSDSVQIKESEIYDAVREIVQRIEKCGASLELTHAVTLASDLAQAIGNKWNPQNKYAVERVRKQIEPPGGT